MKFEWHPATLSRRKSKYYAVMTVPEAARDSLGGQKQVRLSTGTSDKRIAQQRLHDLESTLREKVRRAFTVARLTEADSSYSKAVNLLRATDTPYRLEMVKIRPEGMRLDHDEDGTTELVFDNGEEPEPVPLSVAPTSAKEADEAIKALEELRREYEYAIYSQDIQRQIDLLKRFECSIPRVDAVAEILADTKTELARAFNDSPDAANCTITSLNELFSAHNERRVANGDLRRKTAKGWTSAIEHFVGVVGDLPLIEIRKSHAYRFADCVSDELANKTIKARLQSVSGLLEFAVVRGVVETNPFKGLTVSNYGKPSEHYAPIDDDALQHLFSVPELPNMVRNLWAVCICTGMRLDEVATLSQQQVKTQDGILFFDLRYVRGKTKSAKRKVPICDTLSPLIHSLVTGAEGDLFDLTRNSDGKTRASIVCGEWIAKAELNKFTGDANARYTTHSLRGTFKDKMRHADVPVDVHDCIMGHSSSGAGASYGRGDNLKTMKEAVDRADHPYLGWIADTALPQV